MKFKNNPKGQFEFFFRTVGWLDSYITKSGHLNSAIGLLSKMFRILRTRGKPEAIRYVKRTRLALYKVLSQYSLKELVVKDNQIRFPKDLKFLKRVNTDRYYPCIRLVLSVLYCFRFLRGDGTPSFKTIESPSNEGNPRDLQEYVVPYLRSLGLNPKYFGSRSNQLDFKKFRLTTKAGPKGHALWTSYLDLLSLPKDLYDSIGRVGGPKLREAMSSYLVFIPYLKRYFEARPIKTGTAIRRLAVIQDKEGKNREIAIGDYYTQVALQPLHKYLFRLLAKIPQDSTFNQSKNLDSLKVRDGSSFHSIDLSSATDRFPISLQSLIIETLFGEEFANDWIALMVGYPFEYRGREIFYSRGNPMGFYSSWAAFSVAHHFMVYVACNKAGVNWKRCPYMLLGDDIVIADDKVYLSYVELLRKFDIPFSVEKTHNSKHFFEFSKRVFHEGTEVSPFPLAGLWENRNSWLLAMGTIFEEVHKKRWNLSVDISNLFLGYLRSIGWNSRFIGKNTDYITLVLLIRSCFAEVIPMAQVISQAALMIKANILEAAMLFPPNESSKIILISLQRMFRKDLERITDPKRNKPLGQLAEDIVMIGTSLFEKGIDPFPLIHSCPITRVYGEVEETYLKLRNDPYDYGALSDGKLKEFLFSGSVPASDEVFFTRRKDVLITASCRLANEILTTMRNSVNENSSGIAPMPMLMGWPLPV